jgi:hypothetical protein
MYFLFWYEAAINRAHFYKWQLYPMTNGAADAWSSLLEPNWNPTLKPTVIQRVEFGRVINFRFIGNWRLSFGMVSGLVYRPGRDQFFLTGCHEITRLLDDNPMLYVSGRVSGDLHMPFHHMVVPV